MTFVPVSEWCPDMPDLANASSVALNVIPATPASYGPLPLLEPYSSNAMDSRCIGAVAVQANDLTVEVFAGTTDKLYELTGSSTAWVDVSGSAYTTSDGDSWRFDLYANSVLATNFGNPIQSFALGSSTTFGPLFTAPAWIANHAYNTLGTYVLANGNRYVLTQTGTSANTGSGPSGTGNGIVDNGCLWNYQSGAPPQARHICTPKNFVMVGNTYDPVGGLGPKRVWWCASGDATTWPAPGTNAAIMGMSDYNDFQGNFGEITGLVDSLANADAAIFFRHAVWRGIFVGPPDVFDFFPAENVRGCPCPNGIVPLGSMVYYPGEDGFYVFDGANSTPIGNNKFDAWFWTNVNKQFLWNVVGAPFVSSKAIIWAFPSVAASDGLCDTLLLYRWDIQRASYAYVGPAAVEWVLRTMTFGATLDGLSALGFTDLDTIPASLDSAVWVGGALQMSAVNGSHKLAYFSGKNMAAQVATSTMQITPNRRSFVQGARPLVDLTTGTPTVAVAGRVNLYDPVVWGPNVAPNIMGDCPQRNDARYHECLITVPEGAAWTHIEGVDLTAIPAGWR